MRSGAISPERFREAMAAMPTAVTVITAVVPEGPHGATANAVVSLSLKPPLMLAALDRESRTLVAIEASGRFGVNVLAAEQEDLAHNFATKERRAAKWDGVEWSERDGVPQLAGTVLWLACDREEVYEAGDHVIVTGLVLDAEAPGGDPLVFHGGGYRPLG